MIALRRTIPYLCTLLLSMGLGLAQETGGATPGEETGAAAAPGEETGAAVTPGEETGAVATPADSLVQVIQDDTLGAFLADAEGMTLYITLNDEPGVSNCTGGCAENWPPLTVESEDELVVPEQLQEVMGTLAREDGTLQVTYGEYPLYTYVQDEAEGDTSGEGAGDVWFVASVLLE